MAAQPSVVENAEGLCANSAVVVENVEREAPVITDLDPDQLRAKYIAEKAKRMNKAGLDQYRHVRGSTLMKYMDDPYVEPNFTRDPITAEHEVVILGGGFGGLLVAARLIDAGFKDVHIIEKASDFGGVWYWNRYPGAQCDIESYIYMPLLEELNYIPKEKYAHREELFAHAQAIGRHYDLYSKTSFQTEAKKLTWDEDAALWRFETNHGDKISARWVVPAGGPLTTPKFPGLPGIESFKGHQFHSSRWDYEYTGGKSHGDLEKLGDKRVAIIGTGATAVQIVPHLGTSSKELFVVQRTPSSIDRRGNRPTDMEWVKSLKKGWQQARMDNFNTIISGGVTDEDLVNDGWTDILRSLAGFFGNAAGDGAPDPAAIAAKMQMADYQKMDSIRKRVDSIVKDPKTAESLKPWYNQFCKRPCFHDQYLQTFNRPNVSLVDTGGKGVEAITEKGLVANEKEIELDCIIYATGFEWASDWVERTGLEIVGQNGVTITEKWQDGPTTFHGWNVHNFPNLFFITTAQSGATPNYTHSTHEQSRHFAYVLKKCKELGIKTLQPSAKAESDWVAQVIEAGQGRAAFTKDCTPGYYNDEGKVSDKTTRSNPYGNGAVAYLQILSEWRAADKLDGMDVTYIKA